jgi:stress-induced morphogen
MSGLKSAWELSLEKSDSIVPELKDKKKLTARQKEQIAEIRKEYKAKMADHDIMLQDKLGKLHHRTPPEEIESVTSALKDEFAKEIKALEEEMEKKVEEIRS